MRHRGSRSRIGSNALRTLPVVLAGTLAAGAAFAEEMPSAEQMWQIIQEQQREIDALKHQQAETDEAIEATVEAVSDFDGGQQGWWNDTSIGGYGELHYEGGNKDQLDFHRFVLFFGHEFDDRTRLFTEFELEHSLAGDGKPGEVELEQAWIEFDLDASSNLRAGVFLIPVGILNETHEPPTYFGVERNRVEKNIIPTTWWEGGFGYSHTTADGFRYDLFAHGGLDVPSDGSKAFLIRSGRQKVASSTLRDLAYTGRIRYTGMPGIELASTVQYQADMTQGDPGDPTTSGLLLEAHAVIEQSLGSGLTGGLRALYARWDLDGAAAAAAGRDTQYGMYVEPSLRFGDFGVFARYAEDDNTAGSGTDTKHQEIVLGANYWPHPDVVLKLDYVIETPPGDKEADNRVNIGFGYQF